MKELTYILGAGASYQSMPVVKTFEHRFSVFNNNFRAILPNVLKLGFPDYMKDKFSGKELQLEFMAHQSFDTYFKKLFHKGQQSEINFAKKILHLYFLWEHLQSDFSKPDIKEFFWKQSKVDKRYDAMIAGLLQPISGQSKTFCKTNFITWNYDLNLLSSIKTFFYPDENYADFLIRIQSPTPNIWNIDDQITIINMNGYFYSSFFNDETEIYDLNFTDILNKKITADYFDNNYIDEDANLIKFAWETKSANINESRYNPIEKIAQDAVVNSPDIIIIGYTFPIYNRLQDLEFFDANKITTQTLFDNNNKEIPRKIYIQDPNAIDIKASTIQQFDFLPKSFFDTQIIPLSDCTSFIVPNRIAKPAN
jgi:hypothetical protein